MQLIYRGHIYSYTPATPRPYVSPCAVNWRYRAAGETYEPIPMPIYSNYQPRALNWRFQ